MKLFQCVIRMILRKPQSYVGLLWNAVVVCSVIFCYSLFQYHPEIQRMDHYVGNVSMNTLYILMICAFFSLFYSLAVLYRDKQYSFALLLSMGIRPCKLRAMLIMEMFVTGMVAVGLGVPIGTGLHQALLYFLKRGLGFVDIDLWFSWEAFGITVGSLLFVFLVAAPLIPSFIHSQSVLQLLSSDKRKDDRPEPVVGFLWMILSFLCLGTLVGICCFVTIDNPLSTISHFLICLPLLLLGTYGFYRQGSVYVFKWIRWNREYSWKGIRLLWMGNMAHRMRENARFFFVLSILMTAMFSSVSLFFSFNKLNEILSGHEKDSGLLLQFFAREEEGELISSEGKKLEKAFQDLASSAQVRRVVTRGLYLDKMSSDVPFQDQGEKKKEVFQKRLEFLDHPGDSGVLLPYTAGRFSSLSSYNSLRKNEGLSLLWLQEGEVAVDCSHLTESLCKKYISVYPLPPEWGVKRTLYTNTGQDRGMDILYRGSPSWILEDSIFSKASVYPGMSIERVSSYFQSSSILNLKRMNGLYEMARIAGAAQYGREQNGMQNADSYSVQDAGLYLIPSKWNTVQLFISLSMISFAFLFIAFNFLLLRVYTNLREQRQQFHNLFRIGTSVAHFRKSVTIQMAFLFFLPMGLSIVLSACVIVYFLRFFQILFASSDISMLEISFLPFGGMIVLFLALQAILFLLARSWVFRSLEAGEGLDS